MTSDDLVQVLVDLGVDIRRSDGREISGRCPVHLRVVGHEDRSPSWSMNASTGLWICFSCGARGSLASLVSELTGDPDSLLTVHRLIIETSLNSTLAPKVKQASPEIDWVQFGKFGRVSDKLCQSRNLNPDVAWRYGIRWDSDNKAWVIPIVSPMGELKGWQAKKTGWFRNIPEGVKKSETLFGIERFNCPTAVLVESPLDVVRFASVYDRPQCLASFGASVSEEQIRLLADVADCLIVALDNDEAGIASSKRLFKSLPNFRKGIKWFFYGDSPAKDLGDMTNEEITRGIREATVIPTWIMEMV